MTGIELAKLIKGRRRTEHVPILFLTAHLLDHADVMRGYDTGAVDYLTKPVNAEILRSKIAVFADLYRKSRALERTNAALHRQVVQREAAEETLRRLNHELEERVAERTAALRAADQAKDEFLAALAHELRNPLAALQGAAEVIRIVAPEHDALQSSQGVIARQLRHMARLVDDLLDVSRITRGRLTLKRAPVEIATVVQDALESSKHTLERYRHIISVELPDEPIVIDADALRVAQIIGNLLDNAAKYTDPGGTISVRAGVAGAFVEICVEDNGVGMRPELLPVVFDLFVQADQPDETERGGLGIGLTLVRRLVELHGGTVEAVSAGPCKGSIFTVRLPLAEGAVTSPELESADEPPPGGDGGLRVLIVEDNADAADMMSILVESWGYSVRTAPDGVTALTVAEAFQPQAVLLDIGLPKLDGHGVVRGMRAQAWGQGMLVVAVTGRGQEGDRKRSEDVGIDHHLLKPVDLKLLRDLLADAAERGAKSDVSA
jgi:signal transduction histidine kinase